MYKDFIKKNQLHAIPEAWSRFQELCSKPNVALRSENLRLTIVQELNIGFLIKDVETQVLVKEVGDARYEDYIEIELSVESPKFDLGKLYVLMLIPINPKDDCPTIIGLHGHCQNSQDFRDKYYARDLVREGFIVIIPTFRAMNGDIEEESVTRELAQNGFSLMGLRIYEALLILGSMKLLTAIPVGKIGLMGHSGGSEVAYLTTILNKQVEALAIDMLPKPYNYYAGKIHCQTTPGLDRYNQQICERASIGDIPFKQFEYKYPNQKKEIINFFKKSLND